MARRPDDDWLPMTDDEVGEWRGYLKDELKEQFGIGGDDDDGGLDPEDFDTETLDWMLHHLESD